MDEHVEYLKQKYGNIYSVYDSFEDFLEEYYKAGETTVDDVWVANYFTEKGCVLLEMYDNNHLDEIVVITSLSSLSRVVELFMESQ